VEQALPIVDRPSGFAAYNDAVSRDALAPSSRRLRWVVIGLFVVWAIAIGWQRARAATSASAAPPPDAAWIWASGPWKWRAAPSAFLAACDFQLAEPAPEARLLALADEAFLLWVNGRLVASGEYRSGAGLNAVAIGDRVRAGGNRLVVELRSGRGPGGFLATVESSTAEPMHCATGPSWRIYRSSFPGLFEGWAPLLDGEAPVVWGRPPMGRWGSLWIAATLPRWDRISSSLPPREPQAVSPEGAGAVAGKGAARDVIFDWGEEVEGILQLTIAPRGDRDAAAVQRGEIEPALVWFSTLRPPAHDAEATVAVPNGQRAWRDALPRRFRYARVIGFVEVERAVVLSVPGVTIPPPPPPPVGVLGFEPPRARRSAVAEEIRRRLKAAS
jgi:hypothetical protein